MLAVRQCLPRAEGGGDLSRRGGEIQRAGGCAVPSAGEAQRRRLRGNDVQAEAAFGFR